MWTPEELASRGASKREVSRQRKNATKVRRGFYTDPVEDKWELYRLKCIAVARSISGAVLAGPSAAVVWGLHNVDDPPSVVYIRGVNRGRYSDDVRVVGGGVPLTETRQGVLVTTVAWTVADCARFMGPRDALIGADSALHQGMCTVDEIRTAADSLGRSKNISRVRWVLDNADPRSESPGETWLRLIVKDLGYAVTSQVWVTAADFSARVDLLIHGQRVVLEFDGLIKYDGEDPEIVAATIRREKLRQGELEKRGYQVLRFIWEQLHDTDAIGKRLAYAMRRAA